MKKITVCISAVLIAAAAAISASAASTDKWTAGNGFLIDDKNSTVVVTETEKGIQVTQGGYYTDGKNWGGVAYNEKVDLDGFSLEMTIDKLPDTADDCWISIDFLQKPQLFQVGSPLGDDNQGIVNLIRWKHGRFENYGPVDFSGIGNDEDEAFNLKEGDAVTVKVNKKDGKYVLTVNGIESAYSYDLTGIADDGKAYLVIAASMKDSPADGYQYTITKLNGNPVIQAEIDEIEISAETSDLGAALAVLCVVSLAGALVVSKKLRRA